jgi:fibronectin-binding autotransporter adhesin
MIRHPRKRNLFLAAAAATAVSVIASPRARANDWALTTGGSWATDANWINPAAHPDAVGAVANFTPINTANRTITNDSGAPGFTVGTVNFDLNGAGSFTNSLTVGTAGSSLILNNNGAGAAITTTGSGTGNNTVSVPLVLNDNVTAIVNQTTSTSAAGSLNLTAAISGTGGLTKQGAGTMTLGTGAKTYTGPTVFDTNGGRTRMSQTARPQFSSSITIKSGAQVELITNGDYNFSGPLNLNGNGLAAFPGSIRPTRDVVANITGPTVIQSDTIVHEQSSGPDGSTGAGTISFSGQISGPGILQLTAPVISDNQIGRYTFGSANTHGGTIINAGTLNVIDGAGLGTGIIQVNANVGQFVNTVMNLNATGAAPTTTSGPLSGFITGGGGTTTIKLNGTAYTVNQTADGSYVGAITDGTASGSFGLGATSTKTLTLTGNLSYTGPTSVAGGHLALGTNLTASSGVAVSGGTLELTTGGGNNRVIRTPSVAVTGTGRLDIQDNKIITQTPVGTAAGGVYSDVSGMIQKGRNGGGWGGSGIVTSQPQATSGNFTSIGVATAQQAKGLANPTDTATFGGQVVTGSDTLVMYTYGGDANLDGKINVDDYGHIDSNVVLPGVSGWFNGDFNYDGKINVDDYGIIDSNVPIQGPPFPSAAGAGVSGVSAVPEPASASVVFVAACGVANLRRRRRRPA